ncbi:MAG: metal ABC transporter permease [Gordonia sp. (in: high G+C Gram-positive bacteria)]|uniref:metal ABC transporter permease n=1 Tax=Gordonia sp. (in: high G+C Gram-positive bacteria) TaxID=84139 RepID=UPI0039E6C3E1
MTEPLLAAPITDGPADPTWSSLIHSNVAWTAVIIGGMAALTTAVVGIFILLRGQTFTGHSVGDLSSTGASGAYVAGIPPLWGFLGMSVLGAALMNALGLRNPRDRDVSTGIVVGAGMGLSALFLYWATQKPSTSGAAAAVLFGSLFTVQRTLIPIMIAMTVLTLLIIAATYRPLLQTALGRELAKAHGRPVLRIDILFVLATAMSVAMASMSVGALLVTALLIGPAATGLRYARTPGGATAIACAVGLGSVIGGVVIAYFSTLWTPGHRGAPVSFFIVALVFVCYLLAGTVKPRWERGTAAPTTETTESAGV